MTASAFPPVLQRPCVTLLHQHPPTSGPFSGSMEGSTGPTTSSATSGHSRSLSRSESSGEFPAAPGGGLVEGLSRQPQTSDMNGPGSTMPSRRHTVDGQGQAFVPRHPFLQGFSGPPQASHREPRGGVGASRSQQPPGLRTRSRGEASSVWNFSASGESGENSTSAVGLDRLSSETRRGSRNGPDPAGKATSGDTSTHSFIAARRDEGSSAGASESGSTTAEAATSGAVSGKGTDSTGGGRGSPEDSQALVDSRDGSNPGECAGHIADGPTGKGAGANRIYTRDHGEKETTALRSPAATPSTPPVGLAATPQRELSLGGGAGEGAELLRCDLMWIASGNKGGPITPVESCELHPIVIIRDRKGRVFDDDEECAENPIGKSSEIFFRWMRGPPRAVCTFHPQRTASLQCVVTLRCFCCYDCFRKGYKQLHKFYRTRGMASILPHPNSHTYGVPCRPFDWSDFDANRHFDAEHLALLKQAGLVATEGEEGNWQPVSTNRNYTPTKADVGHQLRLEALVVGRTALAQLIENEIERGFGGPNGDGGQGALESATGDAEVCGGAAVDGQSRSTRTSAGEAIEGGSAASRRGEGARRLSQGGASSDGRFLGTRRGSQSEGAGGRADAGPPEGPRSQNTVAGRSSNTRGSSAISTAVQKSGEPHQGSSSSSEDDSSRFLVNGKPVDMALAAKLAWAAASLHDSSHYRQVSTGCCVPTVDTVPRRRRRLASVPLAPPMHGMAQPPQHQPQALGPPGAASQVGTLPPHSLQAVRWKSHHRQSSPHEVGRSSDGSLQLPPSARLGGAFPGPGGRVAAAARDRFLAPSDELRAAAYGARSGGSAREGADSSTLGGGVVAFYAGENDGSAYPGSSIFGAGFSSSPFGVGSTNGLCDFARGGGSGNAAAALLPSYGSNAGGITCHQPAGGSARLFHNSPGPSAGGHGMGRDGGLLGGELEGAQHASRAGGVFDDSDSDCCLSIEGSCTSGCAGTPRRLGSQDGSQIRSRSSSSCALEELSPEDAGQFNVTVMTWNVLAELYGTLDAFPHCDAYMLAWPYRRQRILDEIVAHDPDVICLQEVQSEHFEDFFLPQLARRGYNGVYKQKTMEIFTSGSGKKSGGKFTMDGCATFYRKSKLTIVDQCGLEFSQLIKQASREQLPRQLQRQAIKRLLKDNVALLLLLEVKNEGDTRAAAKAEETDRGRDTGERRNDDRGNRSSSDSRALSASAGTRSWADSASSPPESAGATFSRGRMQATAGFVSGGGSLLSGANRAESENPRGSRGAQEEDAEPVRSTLRATAPAWGEAPRFVLDHAAQGGGMEGAQWGLSLGSNGPAGLTGARRKLLLVANTHIVANPESNDVKIWQAQTLVGMMEKYLLAFRPPAYIDSPCLTPAAVLCGDFNSTPDSAVYQLVVTGRCDRQHIDLASDRHGLLTELNLGHSIPLKSAYAVSKALKDGLNPHDFYDLRQSEPEFTNYTGSYTGCLDYLFFTDTVLRVREILEPVDSKQLFREARALQLLHQALPSPLRPSDHIPLLCKFEWIA
ncbi:endonuclease/exonuclease/phosphatase family protein [Besnoitia besnoiti]|uniref:Endonuclease/exonuclease/phosphatase family protein n=1 Tax=Besnoitia besnoiti TaxID=94643 RepID=A0A2A9MPY9_BESBE|nr:endonuclease/exonuclease/phosphatase family protein [Besnoitia besnoiti]PFH37952.1 endonuclease/exonuclease/phosphatase family protein [Besnoitia besnoiti]